MSAPHPITRAPAASGELDAAAVRRAQAGDVADRELLVRTYEKRVFAMIGRMLVPRGRGALVPDLAQETFVSVLRSLPGFVVDGPARLSTWILTIATRVAIDELRRPRLVEVPLESAHDVVDGKTRDLPDRIGLRTALTRALAELEPAQQAVLLLRDCHGLEYEEIARALGLNVGTVKSRLSRARAVLRSALEGVGPCP